MEGKIMNDGHQQWTGEEQLIRLLRASYQRHPGQLNEPFAADAELIDLSGELNLACTVDCLREEIELGILENPALIGWTSVAISLSDLAAVAADPVGLLLAWTIPPKFSSDLLSKISRGAQDAAAFHKTYLMGGDCNTGSPLQISATALGTVPKHITLQRVGMLPGDGLFLTGPIGAGNALGFAKLRKLPEASALEDSYRPIARFDWGHVLREFATSCIDTSDGVLASLDILARLNNCGIEFRNRPSFYAGSVRIMAFRYNIPLWLFAAAEHGEFELLFSVRAEREGEFLDRCTQAHLACSRIGTVLKEREFRIETSGSVANIDIRRVRGLAENLTNDPGGYVTSLIEYSSSVGIKEDKP